MSATAQPHTLPTSESEAPSNKDSYEKQQFDEMQKIYQEVSNNSRKTMTDALDLKSLVMRCYETKCDPLRNAAEDIVGK